VGRLGDFAPPGALARWLEAVTAVEDWPTAAAAYVMARLAGGS
jgi:hypothetical protein